MSQRCEANYFLFRILRAKKNWLNNSKGAHGVDSETRENV